MTTLDRELIKWIQSLDLSHPIKNARRDLGNGFLVAEIISRYDRTVEMHSFDTGSAMARRLDNWQQIRKLLANRQCTAVTEEMIDSCIQMRGEGAKGVLEALYEHLTKKKLQAGKITAEKKEAEAANEDLKMKAVLETPAFMRPTAAALLREHNDETVNRLQRLTGRTNEEAINRRNEELLAKHAQTLQTAKEASPERYEPKKPSLGGSGRKGQNSTMLSPNGNPRQAWGEGTLADGESSSSSRTRQKLVVAKHLDVRVVDETVLATFAAREQQAKEEALKNGFDPRESLPIALSRVVYRILKSYGLVEAIDDGYNELYGLNGDLGEEMGLGVLISSRGAGAADSERRDSTSTQNPSGVGNNPEIGSEDVAGTGDYFTKFLVLRDRVPFEVKSYVWNSLISASELGAAPPTSPTSAADEGGPSLRNQERGSRGGSSIGVVARNTARLIAERPTEFQHLSVLFSFAFDRNAAQIANPPQFHGAKFHDLSNKAAMNEDSAALSSDCQFVYNFIEAVGKSLGDRSADGTTGGKSSSTRPNHGLSTDTADFATKLLIPSLLTPYLLPLGTSYKLECCARLILAFTPIRHASEINSVLGTLRRTLTPPPGVASPTLTGPSVGTVNDRFFVVAATFLAQALFDYSVSSSASGGNAGIMYETLCDLNIATAKEALLGAVTDTYKVVPTAVSKAAGLLLIRRTIMPLDVISYYQTFVPSLLHQEPGAVAGELSSAALSPAVIRRFCDRGEGKNSGGSDGIIAADGVPAMADQLLAIASALALKGSKSNGGLRGQGLGLSPGVLQEVFESENNLSTSPATSALRALLSMLSHQLPRFFLFESAFRAPKGMGVSGASRLLFREVIQPYAEHALKHTASKQGEQKGRHVAVLNSIRCALIGRRQERIAQECDHDEDHAAFDEEEVNYINSLDEDGLLEMARVEIPDSPEVEQYDSAADTRDAGETDDGEADAVTLNRFFLGSESVGNGSQSAPLCWLGSVLFSTSQEDPNWEVRLAALELTSALKYVAEKFVVEAQLAPAVEESVAELVAAMDAELPSVDTLREKLAKDKQILNTATAFVESILGRSQESAFIFFNDKADYLRRAALVTVAPFLTRPSPQPSFVDEDDKVVSLENSSSFMASLFVQAVIEALRDSVSSAVSIAKNQASQQRIKDPVVQPTYASLRELLCGILDHNPAATALRTLIPSNPSAGCSEPLDLTDEDGGGSGSRGVDAAVITGGKVVSARPCPSFLPFADPYMLALCVVCHLQNGQSELMAVEQEAREEQAYQQATLGGADSREDGPVDVSTFVAGRTCPAPSTLEVAWLLENIVARVAHLAGPSAQLSALLSAAATQAAAAASANENDDDGDTKSVVSTTSTSAAARLAARQRAKAASSPQALSVTSSVNNNATHQRFRAFLDTIDGSTRQGWLAVLSEVRGHLVDGISDAENIQQAPVNEPLMQALDDLSAALQQQFQRDRISAQQKSKESGIPTGQQDAQQEPPETTELFAKEVQQRCFHVLTRIFKDLKNVPGSVSAMGGQSKGFNSAHHTEGATREIDEINAEREAAMDWLATVL